MAEKPAPIRRIVEPVSPPSPAHNQPSPQERKKRQQLGHQAWADVLKAAVIDANIKSKDPRKRTAETPNASVRQREIQIDKEMATEFIRVWQQNQPARPSKIRKQE